MGDSGKLFWNGILPVILADLLTAQNLALNKPMLFSSMGGGQASNANDGNVNTVFYTQDSPWSFAAVDLEDTYEIESISLKVSAVLQDRGTTVAMGDTAFDFLNAIRALSLWTCTTINVGSVDNPNVQCITPVAGRYVYVFLPENSSISGRYYVTVYEIEVFGVLPTTAQATTGKDHSMFTVDPLSIWPTSSSYVVSLTCRDRLAKTTGLHPCHSMDAEQERPACEIEEDRDSWALLAVAGISGMIQFARLGHPGVSAVCAPLSASMYYCTEVQTGPGPQLEFDTGCPFLNIT